MAAAEAPDTAEAFAAISGASDQEVADLCRLRALVEEGSARANLVGPSFQAGFWPRHAWDSAQLFHVEQGARIWADVGSGAGFPGVVLAILLKRRPDARVHLIESMAKRVRFLEHVAVELALPVSIHHARAEAVAAPPGLEVVTARACAPMTRLLSFTAHLLRGRTRGLFLKGRDVEAELTEARRSWTFHADLIASRSDPSGRIVRMERLTPRVRRP